MRGREGEGSEKEEERERDGASEINRTIGRWERERRGKKTGRWDEGAKRRRERELIVHR